jgi:hypothetical protein
MNKHQSFQYVGGTETSRREQHDELTDMRSSA